MIQSGQYTCLEILALSTDGQKAEVKLKDAKGKERCYEAGLSYYRWLKIPVESHTCYELTCENVDISLAYLSGCEDILERGIGFVNPKEGGSNLDAQALSRHYDTPYREQYHFVPWKNWINDPNGLCWFRGYYHLFYQYNPHGQEWSNMYWGHAVSTDCVHWTHLPLVMEPQQEVLERADVIKGGAFSGSAVVLDDEVVFYLTRHAGPMEDCEDTVQQQWMTRSRDMIEFEPEELIIGERPQGVSFDFRDPKVLRKGEDWYMVLGSAVDGTAAVLLYKSPDMKHWEYVKPLIKELENGIRCFECPDFFMLDGEYVAWGALMCHKDINGRFQMSRYYAGEFENENFTVKNTGWYDFGSNCYAMQSFEHKGRRISIGWISDFYGEHVEVENGAYGSMTIPRVLNMKAHKLYMNPIEEIYMLKGQKLYEGSRENVEVTQIPGNSYYARISFEEDTDFNILLGKDKEKEICFVKEGSFAGIRTKGVKSEKIAFPADVEAVRDMEIFVDRRVVEIYLNGGEAAGTKLFYNSGTKGMFTLESKRPDAVSLAEVSVMGSIW